MNLPSALVVGGGGGVGELGHNLTLVAPLGPDELNYFRINMLQCESQFVIKQNS